MEIYTFTAEVSMTKRERAKKKGEYKNVIIKYEFNKRLKQCQ